MFSTLPMSDATASPTVTQEGDAPGDAPGRGKSRRRRAGLSPARQQLADRYVALARALAKPFKKSFPHFWEEFESASLLALVEAAEAYQPGLNVKFSTFARRRIVGALVDVQREVCALNRPFEGAASPPPPPGGPPSYDEHCGGRVLGIACEPPVGWDLEAREALERLFRSLPPRHAEVCRRIYLRGQTQSQAALEMGLAQSRLSCLHRDALAMLGPEFLAFSRTRNRNGLADGAAA
jgi:RNA polymerase sigma factor (sigma-70 family)